MRISLSALASFSLAGAAAVEVTPSISLDPGDADTSAQAVIGPTPDPVLRRA